MLLPLPTRFREEPTQLIDYPRGKIQTSYTIPSSVDSIEYFAFENCTSLTSVTIPNSVTSIKVYAFSGCTGLTSISIPSSVTEVLYGAFADCTGLTGVSITNGLKIIGGDSFGGCTNLASVTIPASVTTLYNGAFAQCTKLAKAYFLGAHPASFGKNDPYSDDHPSERVFTETAANFRIYFPKSAKGWTKPTWHGYKALPYKPTR